MRSKSVNPFNFDIPEKKEYPFWIKSLLFILVTIFITVPLARIDSSTFKYNEVNYYHLHECTNLKCILISCQ